MKFNKLWSVLSIFLSGIPYSLRTHYILFSFKFPQWVFNYYNRHLDVSEIPTHIYSPHMFSKMNTAFACMNEKDVALYTGRMIYICDEITNETLETLTKSFQIDFQKSYKKLDAQWRFIVEKIILPELNKNLGLENEEFSKNEVLRDLRHEYIHWRIFRETSFATLIEAISFKLRFLFMFLAEKTHQTIAELPREGICLSLSQEDTKYKIKKYEGYIDEIGKSIVCQNVFRDAIVHHFMLNSVYAKTVSMIIEPLTWAIAEKDWVKSEDEKNSLFEEYFFDQKTRRYAKTILDKAIQFLEKNTADKLIKMGRAALNIPISSLSQYIYNMNEDIQDEIYNRFMEQINGRKIEVSPPHQNRFIVVLHYLLNENYDLNIEVNKCFAKVLSEEPKVCAYILATILYNLSIPVYEEPTIVARIKFCSEKKVVFLDSFPERQRDPEKKVLGFMITRTGKEKPFNGLEDVIGIHPITMRTALDFLVLLDKENILQSVGQYVNEDEKKELKKIFTELRTEKKRLNLQYPPKKEQLSEFLRFWLYYVHRSGYIANKLPVLHGITSWPIGL